MEHVVLARHGEIFLKGNNRHWFVDRLRGNLAHGLRQLGLGAYARVNFIEGRYEICRPDQPYTEAETMCIMESVCRTFGIVAVSPSLRVATTMEEATDAARMVMGRVLDQRKVVSFRVQARRAWKGFPLRSPDIERRIGQVLVDDFHVPVNLEHPDLSVGIEVLGDAIYVYADRRPGPGGLPVGVSGRVMVLLSGGFDSPVAAWQIAKRGCQVRAVHFHSFPYTTARSQEKVNELANRLVPWCGSIHLTHIALTGVQDFLRANLKPDLLVLGYRRSMMRIANRLARESKCQAIVTGDNLAQVASQTIPNLAVVEAASFLPVLRPLLTYDKIDIMRLAKDIGTHDISLQPHQDACSLFVPVHPATRARVEWLQDAEAKVAQDLADLENKALETRTELFFGERPAVRE